MKLSQVILFFAFIYCCFCQNADICSSEFENKLKSLCEGLDSTCSLTEFSKRCISNKNEACSVGDGDQTVCEYTFPQNFPLKKCVYNSSTKKCNEEFTTCSDFNTGVYGVLFNDNKDYCERLKADNDRSSCRFSDDGITCKSYSNYCEDLSSLPAECNSNILSSAEKCYYDSLGTAPPSCEKGNRICDHELYDVSEAQCYSLKATDDNKQKCVYNGEYCIEEYIKCADIPFSDYRSCLGKYPLIQNGNHYEYDYTKYCYKSDTSCSSYDTYCGHYKGNDASICEKLKSNNNKTCAFDENKSSNKCYQIYTSCEAYNDNVVSKTREECENVKLPYENKKCIYIRKDDRCIEVQNYTTCEEYKGTDRYVCESIKSNKNNVNCILDSDFTCKERTFPCSEAYNEEDCLFYATPTDNGKKCIYKGGKCKEIYRSCENYLGNKSSECESIELYNGKKCVFEYNLCRSKNKICDGALDKDECNLIAKTGVSDPKKKVCSYLSFTETDGSSTSRCVENYKYCSDYRGDDTTTCGNIKPYDESGDYIDETSYCGIKDDIDNDSTDDLCQRITKQCSEADGNPILCAKISPNIKNNNKKYCAYISDNCVEHYKVCKSISTSSSTIDNCNNNIPEDHLNYHCEATYHTYYSSTGGIDGYYTCESVKNCDSFKEEYYTDLCQSIHNNCTYDSTSGTCLMTEKYPCNQKIFYHESNDNEAICNSLEVSSPNTICTLSEDKSKCKEIFKESSYNTTQENYDAFIKNGISFIFGLLCLMI